MQFVCVCVSENNSLIFQYTNGDMNPNCFFQHTAAEHGERPTETAAVSRCKGKRCTYTALTVSEN